jgi:hypothetical protein
LYQVPRFVGTKWRRFQGWECLLGSAAPPLSPCSIRCFWQHHPGPVDEQASSAMGHEADRHKFLGPVLVSTRPAPPITIDDHGDVEVYGDVQSACLDLEVYDIAVLAAYDRHGRPLRFVTQGYRITDMTVRAGADPEPTLLADILRTFIARVGADRIGMPEFESAELDDLLDGLLRFFRNAEPPATGVAGWILATRRLFRIGR